MIKEWKFRNGKVTAERMRLLEREFAWGEIIQRIADEMTNILYRWRNGDKEAANNRIVEFVFNVGLESLDIFFNGSHGYRARHYLASRSGIECNRAMIDTIKEKLVAAASEAGESVSASEQIMKSLEYGSAKIWISEEDSTLDQTGHDAGQILTLEVPRWVEAMNDVLAAWKAGRRPIPSIKSRALLGVQAPEGKRLKVLGAWMDNYGEEFVVPSKVDRAEHIHKYGFS